MDQFFSWANTKVAKNSFATPEVQKNALQFPQYNPYGSGAGFVGQPPVQQEAAASGKRFGGEFTDKNATAYIGIPKGPGGTGVAFRALGLAPLSPVEIAGYSNSAVFSKGGDAGMASSAVYNGSSGDAANQLR
jgi:hypothetical protein